MRGVLLVLQCLWLRPTARSLLEIMTTDTAATPDGVLTIPFTDWANKPNWSPAGSIPSPGTPGTNPRTLSEPNATYFLLDDVPYRNRQLYSRLKRHNEDKYWNRDDTDKNKTTDTEYHNHIIEAIASHLELNRKQAAYAERLYHAVDKQRLGCKCELTAFCCCIISLRRITNDRDYYPTLREDKKDRIFHRFEGWFKSQFGVSSNRLISVMWKIEHRHSDLPI